MVNWAYPSDSGVDLSGLNPAFAQRLSDFEAAALKAGIPAHVISGFRSPEKQAMLFNTHAGTGSNPVAPPGGSFHNFGMAADIQANDPAQQQKLWNMAPSYGLSALGMKDPNHFQMAGWKIGDPTPSSTVPFTQPPGTTLTSAPTGTSQPGNMTNTPTSMNVGPPNQPTPQQKMASGIGQGAQTLAKAFGGGDSPAPQAMSVPNMQAHAANMDPNQLQQLLLQQRYGLSLGGGGPFQDTQGQGYA